MHFTNILATGSGSSFNHMLDTNAFDYYTLQAQFMHHCKQPLQKITHPTDHQKSDPRQNQTQNSFFPTQTHNKIKPKKRFFHPFFTLLPNSDPWKSDPTTVVHLDPPLMLILQLLPKVTSTNKRIFGSALSKKVRNPQTSCRTEINKLNSLSQHSHETKRYSFWKTWCELWNKFTLQSLHV